MSSGEHADTDSELDEEVKEYINMMHDRIQFLTQELEDAEQTILSMRQGAVAGNDSHVTVDLSKQTTMSTLLRYALFLNGRFDESRDDVNSLVDDLQDYLDEYVESKEDLYNVSSALLVVLPTYEKRAR